MNLTLFLSFLKRYELVKCITSILQNLVSGDEKCLISINVFYDLNIPTHIYSGDFLSNHFFRLDITPDTYLAKLHENSNFFKWIENIHSFNPEASFVLIDGNKSNLTKDLERRYISNIIFLNTSDISRGNCESEGKYDSFYSLVSKEDEPVEILTICVIERQPYVLCRAPNCSVKGDRGLSIDLMDSVVEMMNITPFYKHYDGYEPILNLNPQHILLYDSCDLVQRLIDKAENVLGLIPPVNDDYDIWVVPRSEKLPQ